MIRNSTLLLGSFFLCNLLSGCSSCGSDSPKPPPRIGIEIISPSGNFFTNGSVTIVVSIAAPDEAPEKVELLSNGEVVSEIPDSNEVLWNTSGLAEGTYELQARASHPKTEALSNLIIMTLDRSAPEVESIVPESSQGIAADDSIWLHFSEPVLLPSDNSSSVELEDSNGADIAVEVTLHNEGKTISITPESPLTGNTTIHLTTTSEITDLAKNPLSEVEEDISVLVWGAVGSSLATNLNLSRVQLRTGSNGEIIAGWLKVISEDSPITGTYILSKWAEGQWKEAATSMGIELLSLNSLQMELDSNFAPTVLWQSNSSINLKRWKNNEWVSFPGIPFSASYSSFALQLNAEENPVVATVESSECSQIKIFEWADSQWNSIPNPIPSDCAFGDIAIATYDDGSLSILLQTSTGVWAYKWTSQWESLGASTVHPATVRQASHPSISSQSPMHLPKLRWGDDGTLRTIWGNAGKITAFEFIDEAWKPMGIGELNLRQEEATAEGLALGLNQAGQGYGIFTDLTPTGVSPAETQTYIRYKTSEAWVFSPEAPNGTYLDALLTADGAVLTALLTSDSDLALKRFAPSAPLQYPLTPAIGDSNCGPFEGDPDDVASAFPQTLSDTGCYAEISTLTPTDGAIPFAPNSTLWTDAAIKRRYVFLPTPESQIEYRDFDSWVFPVGTIIMKEFLINSDMADPRSSLIPMETRFLVRENATSWKGYSYQWNPEGTQATLRADASGTAAFTVTNSPGDDPSLHNHFYPSRAQCFECHDGIDADKTAIGLKTGQLDSWYWQSGRSENQLSFMNRHNLLSQFPTGNEALPVATPSPYNSARSLETRVKSYLHANCSHCHFDAAGTCGDHRFQTSLSDSGLCNQLQAGDHASSVLYTRMMALEFGMPPVGRLRVDPQLDELLSSWISQLETCE